MAAYSPYCSLCISCDADENDMFDNPDNFISFRFKIISFTLLTLMFDSGVYCEEKLGASNSWGFEVLNLS